MEIITMTPSAQIPRDPAGNGTGGETGGMQVNSGRSLFFGLLFGGKEVAGGKEAGEALSQAMANPSPDGTPALTTVFPSAGKAVGKLPGQAAAVADAPVAETGMKLLRGEAPGLKVAEGLGQPGGQGVPRLLTLPENAALLQSPDNAPVMPERGRSADSSRPEETDETSGKRGEKAAVPVPLFTAIIPLLAGNPARPPEQSADVAFLPTENRQADAEDISVNPLEEPVQHTAGAVTGVIPLQSVVVDPLVESDASADAGNISRSALAKGAPFNEAEPAGNAPVVVKQEVDGKAPAINEEKATLPRVEGDIREGSADEAGDVVVETAAEKATQAPIPAGSRRIGEAGSAYKAALEQAGQGNSGNAPVSDGSLQGKPPVNADAGITPERVEIVFAAKQGSTRGESGGPDSRKSQEVKTSEAATTISVTPNAAHPRGTGETHGSSRAPGERNLSGEQIVNQVREKLEANGRVADNGRITLRLHPEELGELKINMRLDDHSLKVEIVTQNPSVKEALMQNLDTLKETLSRQNIAMERFDVSADLRREFTQGGKEERRMAQDNRGMDSSYPHGAEVEEELAQASNYAWETENSLVNLML